MRWLIGRDRTYTQFSLIQYIFHFQYYYNDTEYDLREQYITYYKFN